MKRGRTIRKQKVNICHHSSEAIYRSYRRPEWNKKTAKNQVCLRCPPNIVVIKSRRFLLVISVLHQNTASQITLRSQDVNRFLIKQKMFD